VTVAVRWRIDEAVRAELSFFTGLAFSGNRENVRIFVGGRKQGPDIDGTRVKSCGIIAPIGTRLVLCASDLDEGWEEHPWRAVVLVEGSTLKMRDGRDAVQLPDLDLMDEPGAKRSDPDFTSGFPQVTRLRDGTGWTYGLASFHHPLKCNLKTVRLDLVKPKR
jgi:hypothetical protein